jgi:hypothetical protein
VEGVQRRTGRRPAGGQATPGREPERTETDPAAGPSGRAAPEGEPADRTGDVAADPPAERDPLRFDAWRKRSATGAVLTGIAVGLQQALVLPRQEPAIVIDASGEPEDPDHPIRLHFDPDSPADSVAVVRRKASEPRPPSDSG